MKEKRKEKKSKSKVETKPEVEKVEEETKTETVVTEKERTPHRPEVIIKEDVVETATEDQQTTDDTAEIEPEVIVAEVFLPQWGDSTQSEWMYHVPPREDDKDLWAQEWGDFLLKCWGRSTPSD
jgi:hypothetical protein